MSVMAAGSPLRSSESAEWETPQRVFDQLNREFGPFDLDVCATAENAKCLRYFTKEDDGLSQPWTGRCWMNPPYGDGIIDWMEKAVDSAAEGALVVCLLSARTGTQWWQLGASHATLIRFLPGRLEFTDDRGKTGTAPFPSAVMVLGPLTGRHGTKAHWCIWCDEWFYPAQANRFTCSDDCRQQLSRFMRRDHPRYFARLLKAHPDISVSEAAKRLGYPRSEAREALAYARKAGPEFLDRLLRDGAVTDSATSS